MAIGYKGKYLPTSEYRVPENRAKEPGGPLTNINGHGLSAPKKETSKGAYRARAASILRRK